MDTKRSMADDDLIQLDASGHGLLYKDRREVAKDVVSGEEICGTHHENICVGIEGREKHGDLAFHICRRNLTIWNPE